MRHEAAGPLSAPIHSIIVISSGDACVVDQVNMIVLVEPATTMISQKDVRERRMLLHIFWTRKSSDKHPTGRAVC